MQHSTKFVLRTLPYVTVCFLSLLVTLSLNNLCNGVQPHLVPCPCYNGSHIHEQLELTAPPSVSHTNVQSFHHSQSHMIVGIGASPPKYSYGLLVHRGLARSGRNRERLEHQVWSMEALGPTVGYF